MTMSPKTVLVIYAHPQWEKMRQSTWQHLHTLDNNPTKHNIVYYNAFDDLPPPEEGWWTLEGTPQRMPAKLRSTCFDVVILHNLFLCYRWTGETFYLWKEHFNWIGELDCAKLAIPQDECDHPHRLDEWLFDWGFMGIMTNFHPRQRQYLYPLLAEQADYYYCCPGYIDEKVAKSYRNKLSPIAERRVDIVYRAKHLPYWFGSHGQLKWIVGEVLAQHAPKHGLKVDISSKPEDTLYEDWYDFLASGRAITGVEGGSSVANWRGEIQEQITFMLEKEPDLTFEQVSKRMPPGWDSYDLFLTGPRNFEAVITKTCQILIEGEYQDVFEADTHYIPIKRNFSNVDEALEKLKDHRYVQDMVDRAYGDIYLSGKYTYRSFATLMEQAIEEQVKKRTSKSRKENKKTSEKEELVSVMEKQMVAQRLHNAWLEAKLIRSTDLKAAQQAASFSAIKSYQRKWYMILIALVLGSMAVSNIVSLVIALWLLIALWLR